jgi:hypothetical protein
MDVPVSCDREAAMTGTRVLFLASLAIARVTVHLRGRF